MGEGSVGSGALRPFVVEGEFVVVRGPEVLEGASARAMVREDEGVAYVLARADADRLGLSYGYVAAWITLGLSSSLDDVGLTAAVAGALATRGLSCNVLAGLHHDHLLVEHSSAARALEVLQDLTWPIETGDGAGRDS